MTDLSKTPELWLLIDAADAQEGDEILLDRWIWQPLQASDFPDILAIIKRKGWQVRRRMEDPTAPLRAELEQAYKHLSWFRDLARGCLTTHEIQPVIDWLDRNKEGGAG